MSLTALLFICLMALAPSSQTGSSLKWMTSKNATEVLQVLENCIQSKGSSWTHCAASGTDRTKPKAVTLAWVDSQGGSGTLPHSQSLCSLCKMHKLIKMRFHLRMFLTRQWKVLMLQTAALTMPVW
jgi:hypothetical protein